MSVDRSVLPVSGRMNRLLRRVGVDHFHERDTWPHLRVTVTLTPWTWPFRPWGYVERDGREFTVCVKWLAFEVYGGADQPWFFTKVKP